MIALFCKCILSYIKVAKNFFLKGSKIVLHIYAKSIKHVEENKISLLLRCAYTHLINSWSEYRYTPMEHKLFFISFKVDVLHIKSYLFINQFCKELLTLHVFYIWHVTFKHRRSRTSVLVEGWVIQLSEALKFSLDLKSQCSAEIISLSLVCRNTSLLTGIVWKYSRVEH